MTLLDIFGVVFGGLAAISGLLRSASFTRADRKKYPLLKKLDGKKVHLFISTLVFIVLANRYIKKDDDLVDSMDRLR